MAEQMGGATSGPELGVLARLTGVLFSPAKTFESIARRPGWDWLVPAVLLMVAFYVSQSATITKIDIDDAVKTQMKIVDKMSGGRLDEKQREETVKQVRLGMEKQQSPVRRGVNTLFIFIPILIVPLIYHGIAAAFGAKTKYLTVLSGYAYTQIIQIIPALLTAVVALPQETLDPADVQFARVLKSNVGAFLDFETTSKAVLAVASSIDVFDIWAFFVGSIAVSKTTRFSPLAAKYVVAGVWAAYILLKVVLGVLYGSFTG